MANDLTPQIPLSVSTWSRPKRVAFLINPESTNDSEINQIIRYGVGRWGGRFNAMFPTTGTEIPDQWWKAMVSLDPDIVYSLLPLDAKLVWKMNRHILPARIFHVTPEDRDRLGERNLIHVYDIGAIDVQPLPRFVWGNRGSLQEPFFLYIKDFWEDTPNLTFALRNFGTLSAVVSMDTAFRDLPNETIEARSIAPKAILEKVIAHAYSKLVTPIDLSAMFASLPVRLEYLPFAHGFHVVVGDSAYDAMYAWNRGLTSESGQGRTWFWLPSRLAEDKEIIRSLGEWIRFAFWGHNYDQVGRVISYSLKTDQLKSIADGIKEAAHFYFEAIRLNPEQFPFPNTYPAGARQPHHVEQIPFSENKGLVSFPSPPFVTDEHPNFGWMVDLEIQYRPQRYTYTNLRPNWHLPKKLGIAGKFFDPYRESRVVTGGLPSGGVNSTERTIGIRIPSDISVVLTYLEKYHTNYRNRFRQSEVPAARFGVLRTSDKGKYLRGLIQLFGNLFSCGHFFEDPFWRDTLQFMAGRPVDDFSTRKDRVCQVLGDFFVGSTNPVTAEGSRLDELADFMARRLLFRDPPPQVLTKEQFRSRFGQLRGEALKYGQDIDYWQACTNFDEYQDRKFEDLVEAGVLFQGAEVPCYQCGSRYWYSVEDFKQQMKCIGCFSSFPLRPELTWSYRLNDLVRNALKYHGTLAVVQGLYTIERGYPSGMFLFLPCQNIYERDENSPFTDLDLVFIKDGKFIIGEVKSDPNAFDEKDFVKIGDVAAELQPNQVMFAAPADAWPADVQAQVDALRNRLAPLEIEVLDLHLRWL
ncbi:MAG: hypothetical protein ACE5JU_18100 [Candidatus Binatia bacterium]